MAGEIQLNSTSFASESGGTITINNATLASAVDLSNHYASTSEVQGTHTTGTITSGTTALTVASGSGISNGDYVVGEGIAPGTTVSSGGGTTSITLSANAAATLSSDPVSFYTANKALSPGLVAGQLCRAWVNFNDTTTTIRASFNVSSVTDNSTYNTVNFITAMPDSNYCIVGASGDDSGSTSGSWFTTGYNVDSVNTVNTTTSFRIQIYFVSGTTTGTNAYIYAAVFR
jgi:hypothetical protein